MVCVLIYDFGGRPRRPGVEAEGTETLPLWVVPVSSATRAESRFAAVARVVVGSPGRSKQRDYEVEQTWCGEFTRLQSVLVADGFPTKLTQAHEPGTIPLKTVSGKDLKVDGRRILKNRTLSRPDAE